MVAVYFALPHCAVCTLPVFCFALKRSVLHRMIRMAYGRANQCMELNTAFESVWVWMCSVCTIWAVWAVYRLSIRNSLGKTTKSRNLRRRRASKFAWTRCWLLIRRRYERLRVKKQIKRILWYTIIDLLPIAIRSKIASLNVRDTVAAEWDI